MNCPHCRTTLLMSERQSVEIDYCPDCRGVWLDRGELDKIIARTTGEDDERPRPSAPPPPERRREPAYDGRDRSPDDRSGARWSSSARPPAPTGHRSSQKRTSKSFLSDIFDF